MKTLQSLNGSNPIMQYERAARLYCEKAGLDPDLQIPAPHPQGLAVPYFISNWHLVAEDLYDLSMKLVSMKEAANSLVKVDA